MKDKHNGTVLRNRSS